MVSKPLHIRFYEIDGFIKIYGGIRYLVLFSSGLYRVIYNRIRYFTNERSGIKDKNYYYYNIFLENGSSEDKSNTK